MLKTNLPTLTTSLSTLLSQALGGISVGACTPSAPGDLALGLYLYSIRPCTDVQPPRLIRKGASVVELPPRFLTLYYLITAYSKVDEQYQAAEDQRILFRAIETLESLPVLTERELGFSPGTYIDRLQTQLLDITPEQMANIWVFRETNYRLSVGYRVFPVEVAAPTGQMLTRVSEQGVTGLQK